MTDISFQPGAYGLHDTMRQGYVASNLSFVYTLKSVV